jgi:ATP-dependent Clp endopeptidase proteolytic subunit ClpP
MSKFEVVAKSPGVAEITIYDTIDRYWGISAKSIYDQLKELGEVEDIILRLNSNGGSVIEGTAIYNLLKQHSARVTVKIDGLAASMASIVAMAGDDIEIGEGAYLMIHDPLGCICGDSDDMRDMADLLDKMRDQFVGIYARRTSQSEEQIKEWMKAETWMTAEEAVKNRFADRAVDGLKVAAMAPVGLFEHPPQALLESRHNTKDEVKIMPENTTPKPATLPELKACCPGADAEFLIKQMEAQATTADASKAWMGELQRRSEAEAQARKEAEEAKAEAEKQLADAKAEAEKTKTSGKPGVEALGGGSGKSDGGSGDPIAEFEDAVDEKVKTGMDRPSAIKAVVKNHPELHASYVEAHNRNVGPSTFRGQRS